MKHNSYFEGKVQSLSLGTKDGDATVGVITKGVYSFATAAQERMVVTSGSLKVKLPGQDWKTITAPGEFVVAANASFDVEADSDVSYICYYG